MTTTTVATLPSFLLIGAMRAGTTTLHHALAEHPQVFMAEPKELHFFVATRNWSRGVDWYARQFSKGAAATARGEASATYTQSPQVPGVPERAAAVVPGARIVYVVRDPIERMRSHYEHDLRRGLAGDPIRGWERIAAHGSAERALRAEAKYLATSLYAEQLERWLEHYDADQICVLTSEWLWADPQAALREVFSFLGVDASWQPPPRLEQLNSSTRARSYHRFSGRVPRAITRAVPAPVKRRLVRRVSEPPDLHSTLTISAVLHEELRERLAGDVRRLRAHVRGPFDGWGIA
jgi:LPS sulfotransferase NodH